MVCSVLLAGPRVATIFVRHLGLGSMLLLTAGIHDGIGVIQHSV